MKSRSRKWAGYLTRMGEKRNPYWFWWGSWKERDKLEDLWLDGTIDLKETGRDGCSGSEFGQVASSCKCGNEPSVSKKNAGNFFTS